MVGLAQGCGGKPCLAQAGKEILMEPPHGGVSGQEAAPEQVQDVTRTAGVTSAPQGSDQMLTEQRAEPRLLLE